jgi:hypothetical protein
MAIKRLGITLADVRDALDRFSATVISHHTRLHRLALDLETIDSMVEPFQPMAKAGFGNVGSHAALGLASKGVKIVGIGDHTVALYDTKGFAIPDVIEHVAKHRVLKGFADQATIAPAEPLTRRCDILASCAVERVIDAEVAAKLQCRVIAEGANGPTAPEADLVLARRNDGTQPRSRRWWPFWRATTLPTSRAKQSIRTAVGGY